MIADLAHAQGALVGYVHPFDWDIDPAEGEVAHQRSFPPTSRNGKVDYIEIVGFSDHKATAKIWYRLLNLGFRLPAGAGHRRDGQLRVAARAGRHEPRVPRHRRRATARRRYGPR